MSTPPSLCNLPTELAESIFNRVGLRSIQNLRKVCHVLRTRIDDIRPEGYLSDVYIDVSDFRIRLMFSNVFSGVEDIAEYQKIVESGWSIVRSEGPGKIVNRDFIELASQDFLLILKFQEKSINSISFSNVTENSSNFLQFVETLNSVLPIENRLLKVDRFTINTIDEKSMIATLSLINPLSIKYMKCYNSNEEIQPIEFSEIIEMEQWKNAKCFISESLLITGVSVLNFLHFSSFTAMIQSIKMEELLELKKIFENSTEATQFHITYATFEDIEEFLEKLGPYVVVDYRSVWFFRMSTTVDDVLSIHQDDPEDLILFQRCAVRFVPADAVIQN